MRGEEVSLLRGIGVLEQVEQLLAQFGVVGAGLAHTGLSLPRRQAERDARSHVSAVPCVLC